MAESDNAVKQYEVYYKEISENATTIDIFGNNENVNVTRKATTAVVDGLQKGRKHQFFVIARNQGSLRPEYQTSSPFFNPFVAKVHTSQNSFGNRKFLSCSFVQVERDCLGRKLATVLVNRPRELPTHHVQT